MLNFRKALFLIFITISTAGAQEELFEIGTAQNPPGISWRSLQTPHFQIIHPEEIGGDAQRVANLLERIYPADCNSLGVHPGRLPLILHNRNTESNGFAGLAPRRSEWFNTPPQVGLIGPVGWYPLLAIHEFRHVVQFQRMNYGFNRLLYYMLGEMGWMSGAAFSVPQWFWEGDAVVMETALTRGGRGRQPEFLMPIRTMLLSGKRYSYYKMTLGSYKNWIANPYEYGFVLNTWLRRQHGAQLWPDVLKSTSALSFIPFRFSWALKRRTGMGAVKSHGAALGALDSLYRANRSSDPADPVARWDRDNKGFWTVYQAPRFADDGSAIVLKYGLADQSALVRIQPDGREEVLLHPNPVDETPHSLSGAVVVWAERVQDPRWGYQNSRAIKRYDLSSGTVQTLVAKSRYFAPALSPDGKTIAAVQFEQDNRCRLVLLYGENGAEIRRFDNPDNDFLMTPHWSPDGRQLVISRLTGLGRALTIVDLDDGKMSDLIPPGAYTLATPFFCGAHILFSSSDGDVEQIFAVSRKSRRLYRVTFRPYGAFFPAASADGRRLLFNDYDLDGYHLAEMVLDSTRWAAIDRLPMAANAWFEPVAAQEAGTDLLTDIPRQEWPVQPFRAWRSLKVHSWQIYADETARTLGGRLFSQNLPGTFQASAGYDYDRQEKAGAASASLTWARLYPLFDLGAIYGHRASAYTDNEGFLKRYSWEEKSAYAGVRLPLNLSRKGYTTALILQSNARQTWLSDISDAAAMDQWENREGWLRSMHYSLSYYHYRGSRADIFPVRGQVLRLGYDHTPWESRYQGSMLSASASLYLPGLARRHGLALKADYEKQKPENYRFSSAIRFPRGYGYRYHEQVGRLAIDYALPLAYPDRHLWALLYIQRIRSAFFYDYGCGSDRGTNTLYRSAGVELNADVNLLSLPVNLEMGVRIAWRERDWHSEFIVGLPL